MEDKNMNEAAKSAIKFFNAASVIFYLFALATIIGGILTLVAAAPEERRCTFVGGFSCTEGEWDAVGAGAGIAFLVSAIVWVAFGLLSQGLVRKTISQRPALAEEWAKKSLGYGHLASSEDKAES